VGVGVGVGVRVRDRVRTGVLRAGVVRRMGRRKGRLGKLWWKGWRMRISRDDDIVDTDLSSGLYKFTMS
jgi:hypothetical protein